ncbi:MAG: hypothetical protein WA994_00305, partial [Ornithinimicrobium sp.]
MATRSPQDYPWPAPLSDGLLSSAGFAPDVPWSTRVSAGDPSRTAVLAVGSNAAVEVLTDKLMTVLLQAPHDPVAVEVCTVVGVAVGHSAHVSRDGFVAASPYLTGGERPGSALTGPATAFSVGWFTA